MFYLLSETVPAYPLLQKGLGYLAAPIVTIITCYLLQVILLSNYLLPIISVLVENTLLKTACHFLLLLVGFDTLTYRKDYDRSPILVGHHYDIPVCTNRCKGNYYRPIG